MILYNDNDDSRRIIEHCYQKRMTLVNPIIDWSDDDVWEFIHEYGVPYCSLYDRGKKRLGCIGCPMGNAAKELEEYPKFQKLYLGAFGRMLDYRNENGLETNWKTPQDVMDWWLKK